MITSVYLSNNIIQVVMGDRGRVDKAFSVEIMEGSLLNGLITNEQELVSQLEEIWKQYQLPKQNVELVINSSDFVTKVVRFPKLSEKKISELLPLEFAEVERHENAAYDYLVLEQEKQRQELMAVMFDPEYIQGYVQLFQKLGIQLSRITTAYTSLVKELKQLLPPDQKASVIQILDGNTLVSVLWINGKYTYTNKKRVFSEPGSEAFAAEVIRNVSTMIQFHSSLKSEYPIDHIYLCGMTDSDLLRCQQSAEEYGIGGTVSGLQYAYERQLFTVGNLISAKKDVDLLQSLKRSGKKKRVKGESFKLIIIPAGLFGICLIISAILLTISGIRSHQVSELQDYLTDPQHIEKQLEVMAYEAENQILQATLTQEEQVIEMQASFPYMNSQVSSAIVGCALPGMTVQVSAYQASDGKVSIQVTCQDVNGMNQYVDALEETGLFRSVQYQGYEMQEKDGVYTVNMNGYLVQEAGR